MNCPCRVIARSGLALAALCAAPSALVSGADAALATILFVVNSTTLDAQETAKKTTFEGWGYTVTVIAASATQTEFNTAVRASSVAYISETVTSTTLGTKLTNAPIGVITEESALSDDLGISGWMTTFSGYEIDIVNTTHYITNTLTAGVHSFATAAQPVRYLSGAAGGYTVLGRQPVSSNPTMVVMERTDTLTPSGTAAGRRVYLPFGNTGFNFTQLSSEGLTLVKRSIEWCLLPVAHYTLDDASGSVVTDSVSGLNGTKHGGSWVTLGRKSGALQLNGSTDYVNVANHAQFQVTQALTIAGWIKGNSWATSADVSPILRKGTTTPLNWQLAIADSQAELILDYYDSNGYRGSTTLPTNTWVHVAGTWDGQTAKVYVNGVLDHAGYSHTTPLGTDTRDVFVGGRIDNTDVTDGMVDDVRFYSRALTAEEIAILAKGVKVITWKQASP